MLAFCALGPLVYHACRHRTARAHDSMEVRRSDPRVPGQKTFTGV